MSRSRRYVRWADGVCLALIFIYLVAATLSINSLIATGANGMRIRKTQVSHVLAETSEVKFPEQDNVPSPNFILSLVNEERMRAGLQPLRANVALGEIAKRRADDMALRSYYAHKNPEGLFYYDYLAGTGAEDTYSCENLDLQFSLAPSRYVNDWLQSKGGHKGCLLSDQVDEAGYAVSVIDDEGSGQKAYIVVAIHGSTE